MNGGPLALLGFAPGPDGAYDGSQITPSAVRRAYAQKLKTTRPDDDPAAFQQLHQAYRAALEICQWLEQGRAAQPPQADGRADTAIADSQSASNPVSTAQPHPPLFDAAALTSGGSSWIPPDPPPMRVSWTFDPPAAPPPGQPPVQAFTPDAFLRELEQAAAQNSDAAAFAAWLENHPALYALRDKARAGAAVEQSLTSDSLTALTPAQCEALADFFDFWLDPEWLKRRAALMAIRARNVSAYDSARIIFSSRFVLRQLERPLSRWRAIGVAAIPGMSLRIARLGRRLSVDCGLPPGALPSGLDAASFAFYCRFGYLGVWQIVLRYMAFGIWIGMVMELVLVWAWQPENGLNVDVGLVLVKFVAVFLLIAWLAVKGRLQIRSKWLWWLIGLLVYAAIRVFLARI